MIIAACPSVWGALDPIPYPVKSPVEELNMALTAEFPFP